MGGYGSTRWQGHTKKLTVEDCWTISISRLTRDGWIKPEGSSGSIWWTNHQGERLSSVSFILWPKGDDLIFELHYSFKAGRNQGQSIREPIRLLTTEPFYGGRRWWFECPLTVNGRACNRRVAKLYLPPGGLYYGCRHCYDLSYTSAQEAHKYDRLGGGLGVLFGELDRLLKEEKRLEKLYSKRPYRRKAS